MHKTAHTSGRRFVGVNFLVAASLPLMFGCSLDVAPEFRDFPVPNVQITVLSGDNQNVPAGSTFPEPVRVRVLVGGVLFSNGNVNYTFTTSAPPATQSFAVIDAQGIASIQPTAGAALGPFTLRVYYAHCTRPGLTGCQLPVVEVGAVTVNGTVVAATP